MDFTNRSAHHPASRAEAAPATPGGAGKGRSSWPIGPMWMRVMWVVLLFSGTVLAVSLLVLLYFGEPKESKYINKDRVQAVFLASGQVYFGDIVVANDQFIDLQNIYYLSVSGAVQPADTEKTGNTVQLVKLGCELHGPLDQMIINREQVTFWENLKADGKVAKAIDEWVKANPNGQKCTDDASPTDSSEGRSEP